MGFFSGWLQVSAAAEAGIGGSWACVGKQKTKNAKMRREKLRIGYCDLQATEHFIGPVKKYTRFPREVQSR